MHADRYNSAKNGRANQSRLKSQLRKKATRNTRMVSNVRYVESQGQFGTIPLHSSVNSRNNRCLLVRTGKKEGVDSSTLLHSTPTLNEALWLRKLRNRLSQRAFRLRSSLRLPCLCLTSTRDTAFSLITATFWRSRFVSVNGFSSAIGPWEPSPHSVV